MIHLHKYPERESPGRKSPGLKSSGHGAHGKTTGKPLSPAPRQILRQTPCRTLCLALCLILAAAPALAMFGELTVAKERELGEKFNAMLRSRLPIIEDPEITSYVSGLVERIHKTMPEIPFDLTTSVVRNNSINAFAAPAGYVYIFTGLIHYFDHEAEVAGVISHELAHVSQRHIASRLQKMQMVGLGSMAGALAGVFLGSVTNSPGASAAGNALVVGSLAAGPSMALKYSREDEREADTVGLNYLTAAGYRPQGMVDAFQKIEQLKGIAGGAPGYLRTHPDTIERMDYLTQRIATMPEGVQKRGDDDTRFKRIQALVRARYVDPDLALPTFENQDDPTCMDLMGKAIVLHKLRKNSQAREAFEKAVACAPDDPLVLREAGRFHFESGSLDLAARYLQRAVLRNPRDIMALFFYARMLAEKGQTDRAVEYFRRVLKKLPDEAEVHFHLGRLLGQSGDVFGAHLHLAFAGVYARDKKTANFHLDKAKRLAKNENQKKELAGLEKVFKARAEFW